MLFHKALSDYTDAIYKSQSLLNEFKNQAVITPTNRLKHYLDVYQLNFTILFRLDSAQQNIKH